MRCPVPAPTAREASTKGLSFSVTTWDLITLAKPIQPRSAMTVIIDVRLGLRIATSTKIRGGLGGPVACL